MAHRDRDGYGRFQVGDRHRYAHRLVLSRALGRPLRPGMVAMHSCDNPPCVNPAHLREATRAENNRDMLAKGRHRAAAGPHSSSAKLDGSQVLEIRTSSASTHALALRFGVSRSTIRSVLRGSTYHGFVPQGWRPRGVESATAVAGRNAHIRGLAAAGQSTYRIAAQIGISQSRVAQIVSGEGA